MENSLKLKSTILHSPHQDRGGFVYLLGIDLMGLEQVPVITHLISRSRQEEKSLGLSGRQKKKWRKACRRNVGKFLKDANGGN